MDHPERVKKKLRPRPDDRCLVCKKTFVKRTSQHALCSDACRRERSRLVAAKWYEQNREEHIAKVDRQRRERLGKEKAEPAPPVSSTSKPARKTVKQPAVETPTPVIPQLVIPLPQTLIVMQGLPGAGKSTLARMIAACTGAVICSTDDYHVEADGVYRYKANYAQDFHRKNQLRAAELLKAGKSVIVDNTNIRNWDASHYVKEARKLGVPVQFIRVSSPFKSTHGVPEETIARMRATQEVLSVEAALAT